MEFFFPLRPFPTRKRMVITRVQGYYPGLTATTDTGVEGRTDDAIFRIPLVMLDTRIKRRRKWLHHPTLPPSTISPLRLCVHFKPRRSEDSGASVRLCRP